MKTKILTVDDSRIVRIMVTRALAKYDCQIAEASNGEEGLKVAAQERPDLILLDVTMPVMDGMTMLDRLRSDATLRSTPVVMLTAESAQENIARADKLGISGYIAKPFKEDGLVAKLLPLVALKPKTT